MTISERSSSQPFSISIYWGKKVKYLNEKPVVLVRENQPRAKKRCNSSRVILYEEINVLIHRAIIDLRNKQKSSRYSRRIELKDCKNIFAVIQKVAELVLDSDHTCAAPTTPYEGRLLASLVLNQMEAKSCSPAITDSTDDLDERQRCNPQSVTVGELLHLIKRDWDQYEQANVINVIVGKKGFMRGCRIHDITLYKDRIREFGVDDCKTLYRVLLDWGTMDELASKVWDRFFTNQNEMTPLNVEKTIS